MWRGEIWWADLPDPGDSEPGYRRPVVIVSDDGFNASSIRTVIAVALTSNIALANAPGNVFLTAAKVGLPRDSVINVSQLITVAKSQLTQRVGKVGANVIKQIDEGLRLVLSLK